MEVRDARLLELSIMRRVSLGVVSLLLLLHLLCFGDAPTSLHLARTYLRLDLGLVTHLALRLEVHRALELDRNPRRALRHLGRIQRRHRGDPSLARSLRGGGRRCNPKLLLSFTLGNELQHVDPLLLLGRVPSRVRLLLHHLCLGRHRSATLGLRHPLSGGDLDLLLDPRLLGRLDHPRTPQLHLESSGPLQSYLLALHGHRLQPSSAGCLVLYHDLGLTHALERLLLRHLEEHLLPLLLLRSIVLGNLPLILIARLLRLLHLDHPLPFKLG